MSLVDKIKSWFSGGSEDAAAGEPAGTSAATTSAEAPEMPAAPVDPLGTPMPGGPATMPPPAGTEADPRDDEV